MKKLFSLVIALSLSACATGYKPAGWNGGFTETQLDTDVFRVSFKGNGVTSPDRAEEMVLLRSADLALKNGFAYFIIINSKSHTEVSAFTSASQSTMNQNGKGFTTTGGQTFISETPSSNNTIKCFKYKPAVTGMIFDAQFVFNSLSKKYIK